MKGGAPGRDDAPGTLPLTVRGGTVRDLVVYGAGVITLPAMYGSFLLVVALFVPDGFISRECGACDWGQHDRVPIVRWARWRWHRIWGRIEPWHRRSLAVLYLERGADPINGRPLGPEFVVYGEGQTNLTNLRIRTGGRRG